ncbi:hypothetical protein GCM10009558_037660 [Virgisporangium aurantiacum]
MPPITSSSTAAPAAIAATSGPRDRRGPGPNPGGPDMGGPDMGGPDMGGPDMGGPDMGGPDIGGPDMGGLDIGWPCGACGPAGPAPGGGQACPGVG